ncbi:MAG: DUF59 domain-containing protein [Alphaproteobacteria bacterium]|nr:DUF59 domain-containing protein [Alphaproteobacteria bacterium]
MHPQSEPVEEGTLWYAGEPLEEDESKVTGEGIVVALRTVYDPEIPVNIFDIGLIYDLLQSENGDIEVVMTLTSPNCPVAGILPQQVADAVGEVQGVGEVMVRLTWSPTWTMDMMSEDAKMALGML